MMEDQSNQYLLELEKLMSVQIAMTFWAHNMDILVIVTQNNIIAGYRISFKAQRFFQIQQSQPIKSLCFSPDSHQIAYGLINGTIKIIKTQNGQNITLVDSLHSNQIFNLNFVQFQKIRSQQFIPFAKNSIQNKLILNISPHKNCNKNAIIKINYFNELKENFTCLLLSEKQKTWLLINGFIPIAYLNYTNMFQGPFRVLFSHFKQKIYSIIAQEVDCKYQLSLVSFRAQGITSIKRDIIKYNCLITYISEVLNFVETTYSTLQSSVKQIRSQYNRIKNLVDDSTSPDINPCQQLFRYLNTGVTSSALIHFLTKQIHDSKKLQKLDETLTQLFAQLHDIILESVQNSYQRITIFLNKLINYSKVNKFKQFGITTQQLQKAQQQVKRLYVLGQILLVQSTQTKFDIRNLLVWLNKATIKTVQDNDTQIQNTNSYLNKYTVDYNRLYRFLENEDKFNLDNLLIFFRKTQDKRPMKIPEPDFNLINKGTKKKVNDQAFKNYKIMEKLLQVQDIQVIFQQKMEIQESYKSFKCEIKDLIGLWKDISKKPIQYLSSSIEKQYQKNPIGSAQLSQKYQFLFKPIVKDCQLFLYYVERYEHQQRLVQYNCNKKRKKFVKTNKYNILSLAVAQDIILVLEDKRNSKKIVAQVANEQLDGSEIQFGKTIIQPDQTNELNINSSLRGLNSLIVGKTKLVIFD